MVLVFLRRAGLGLLAALLAGCAQAAAPPKEAPPATRTATAASPPSATAPAPSATIIAEQDNNATIIAEQIAILQPGAGSQLVSPIQLQLAIPPGSGLLRIELYRQDGQLISRLLLPPQSAGPLQLSLPFEVSGDQSGLFAFSEQDAFGRLVCLVSAEVELLAEGRAAIQPAVADSGLQILSPEGGSQLAGGPLAIRGRVQPAPQGPLQVRLLDRQNRVVASADRYLEGDGDFEFELYYAPAEAGWFLLTISQREQGLLTALDSVEIWLEP